MKRHLVALAAVLATALTACSDPGSGPAASGPVTWPEPTARLEGVTLTVWAAQNSNTVPAKVVEGFQSATGATVKVVTIPDPYEQGVQTKVATGDKPNLAFWQPTESQLTALNAKQNLQSLDDAPWLDSYNEGLADLTGTLGGTRYAALVTSPAVEGVYYNKQVLAEAGVTTPPKTLDELIELGRSLKSDGQTPFYEMGGEKWATQWWVQVQLADAAKDGLWDRVSANEESFTDPTIQDAIDNYDGWIEEGLFNSDIKTATLADQAEALLSGDAAMVMQVNSFFGQMQATADTAELDEKIGFFPIGPTGNVGTVIPDQSNALVAFDTGDEESDAAARQFLAYWLGDGYADFVESAKTVSLMKDVETPADVPEARVAEAEAVTESAPSMQVAAVANPDLYLNLADMIQGTKTPAQVGEATQKQFAELAKAQGASGF